MGKIRLTVFLCAGKDCGKVWKRLAGGRPGKWLRRRVDEAGLPYKLNVVETECMDRCGQAACLCGVLGGSACLETLVRSEHDADRVLASLRSLVESATPPAERA